MQNTADEKISSLCYIFCFVAPILKSSSQKHFYNFISIGLKASFGHILLLVLWSRKMDEKTLMRSAQHSHHVIWTRVTQSESFTLECARDFQDNTRWDLSIRPTVNLLIDHKPSATITISSSSALAAESPNFIFFIRELGVLLHAFRCLLLPRVADGELWAELEAETTNTKENTCDSLGLLASDYGYFLKSNKIFENGR